MDSSGYSEIAKYDIHMSSDKLDQALDSAVVIRLYKAGLPYLPSSKVALHILRSVLRSRHCLVLVWARGKAPLVLPHVSAAPPSWLPLRPLPSHLQQSLTTATANELLSAPKHFCVRINADLYVPLQVYDLIRGRDGGSIYHSHHQGPFLALPFPARGCMAAAILARLRSLEAFAV